MKFAIEGGSGHVMRSILVASKLCFDKSDEKHEGVIIKDVRVGNVNVQ